MSANPAAPACDEWPDEHTPPLAAALRYAALGLAVFPCRGKVPLTEHGCKDASVDDGTIRSWWARWPDASVAIAPDEHMVVLDFDDLAAVPALEAKVGPLPETARVRTGGGGLHVYLRLPEGAHVKNKVRVLPGLDLRTTGGYVITAPSLHASGCRYQGEGDGITFAACPPALVDLLVAVKPEPERPPAPKRDYTGQAHPWAAAGLDRLVGELATTPEGGRNHAMNGVAYRAGRFVGGGLLERSHVEAELRAAAQACGLGEAEIEKVLRVGGPLDVGAANPVEPPPSIAERYERIKFPDAGAAGGNGRSSGAHATGETETESGPEPGQRPGAAPFPLIAVRDISEIITQKWLVHGLIPRFDEGACGYYFAPAKARKSLFLADLALSVATGTPALGRYDVEKPGAVVGFYAEDPKGETSRRVHRLARGRGIEVPGNLYLLDLPALAIDNPEHQSRLLATLLAVPDLALVFLDPMIRLHHANDNKAEELGPIHTFLRTMSRSCAGVVFMLAHHTNKAGDSRGSTEYGAFGDFNLYAAKDADETRVHTVENRGGPAGKPFRYRVEDGTTCAGLPTMRLVASDLNEGEDKAEQDDRGRAAVSEYRTAHPGEPGRVAMRELRKRGLKVASADFWKWWNPPKEGA